MSEENEGNEPKKVSEDEHTEELKAIINDLDGKSTPKLASEAPTIKVTSTGTGETDLTGEGLDSPIDLSSLEDINKMFSQLDAFAVSDDQASGGVVGLEPETTIVREDATYIQREDTTETIKKGVSPAIEEELDEWGELLGSEIPSGEFFKDLPIFFVQLGRAFSTRYGLWEDTFNVILAILRKMRQTMEDNTDRLIKIIEELYARLIGGFQDFKKKEAEVDRFSDIIYKDVAAQFRKTLELLNFQIREFKLQRMVNSLYSIYLN